MREAILYNGLIKAYENGDVYRLKNGQWELCQQYGISKNYKYNCVWLRVDGKQKNLYVHRIIAEAFIPNPNKYPQVNHKDGNPSNNRADNLEWCTPSQNIKHAYDNGLIDPMKFAYSCPLCGNDTKSNDGICSECKPLYTRVSALIERQKQAKAEANSIIYFGNDENTKRIIELRGYGLSQAQIAKRCGLTKQRIEQKLKSLKNNRRGIMRTDASVSDTQH